MHFICILSAPIPLLKILIEGKCDINAVDNRGRTPLHIAVNANRGSTDVSSETEQYLIETGSDVYAMDIRGRTPLHYVFVKIGRLVVSVEKLNNFICSQKLEWDIVDHNVCKAIKTEPSPEEPSEK